MGDPPVSGVCDEGESPLAVAFPDEVVHKQVLRLLLVAAKRQLGRSDVVETPFSLHSRTA